jgi:hypothetical protein
MGPHPKEAHQRKKFTIDIFKILPKAGKSQILVVLRTAHGGFLEGVYEIELDTKTEYGGF